MGCCRAEDLANDCTSPLASLEWALLCRGHAPVQLGTLVFAGLAQSDQGHATAKMYPSCRILVRAQPCCMLCLLLVAAATWLFSHSSQITVTQTDFFFCVDTFGFYYCFALYCVGYNTVTAIKYFGSQQNKCLTI